MRMTKPSAVNMSKAMAELHHLRGTSGEAVTHGLPDATIERFLAQECGAAED